MRLLSFAALLALAACQSTAPLPAAGTGRDHAALHVSDLSASVAFYERVFGLDEIPAPGDPEVIRWLGLDGAELHLIRYDGDVPATTKAVHFALRVPDLDALVNRVERLGVPYSDWPGAPSALSVRGDGVRQIYVRDPDGYWIEVNDVTS
jgi:catechol 2,3-dioxygenase-like lactoylglutathione lyase family enzyme